MPLNEDWIRRFYNSGVWKKKRAYIILRDKTCQRHKIGGKPCKYIATEVHHIKELKDYPELALVDSNLIGLCWRCHEDTKKRTKKQREIPKGVRVIKA